MINNFDGVHFGFFIFNVKDTEEAETTDFNYTIGLSGKLSNLFIAKQREREREREKY